VHEISEYPETSAVLPSVVNFPHENNWDAVHDAADYDIPVPVQTPFTDSTTSVAPTAVDFLNYDEIFEEVTTETLRTLPTSGSFNAQSLFQLHGRPAPTVATFQSPATFPTTVAPPPLFTPPPTTPAFTQPPSPVSAQLVIEHPSAPSLAFQSDDQQAFATAETLPLIKVKQKSPIDF
jgi:hypothetical protein